MARPSTAATRGCAGRSRSRATSRWSRRPRARASRAPAGRCSVRAIRVRPVPRRLSLAAVLLSLSTLALVGCSGVVPKPQLSVSPNPVAVGQTVTLDGRASSNLLAEPAISFDLDGDGETDRTGTLLAQTSYSQPGKVTVSLIISQGSTFFIETRGITQTITVTDPHLPTPDFAI